MSRGRPLVADQPEQAPKKPEKAVASCVANGCPLPGTIKPESGEHVCAIHFLANKAGWPKATAVILDHLTLHDMAKRAQMAGTPLSISAESAALLFDAAKAHDLEFNDAQREIYRRAAMKLTVAGVLVEAAISAAAVKAATVKPESREEYSHVREADSFNGRLRGLLNNMRLAA